MSDLLTHLSGLARFPDYDFGEFCDTETVALTRIQRRTGARLGRSWLP